MTIRDQLAAIVTVPNFRAWLVTKDPTEEFPYGDNHNCAVAQFLKSSPEFQALIKEDKDDWGVGGDYVRVGTRYHPNANPDNWVELPRAIEQAAWAKSHTFGGVLVDLDAYTP